MKKIILLLLIIGMTACKKKQVAPVSERFGKVWTAQVVKENSTTVYTKGAASNIKSGYSNYKLDLSSPTSARLTEFEGTTFTGQWAISSDEKLLTLSALTPEPTGSGGTIQYNIVSIAENELSLSLIKSSVKTGGSLNEYQLEN